MTTFTKDPSTYRYRSILFQPRTVGDVTIIRREIVIVASGSGVSIHVEENGCQNGEPVFTRPVSSRFMHELKALELPDGAELSTIIQALCSGDLRGQYELDMVGRVFWKLVVLDLPGWGLMEEFLPEDRVWHDRELSRIREEKKKSCTEPPPSLNLTR
jgi:hypothetical protein